MKKEDLDKFANVARSMTGSTINTDELFKKVNAIDVATKKEIYLKTDSMLKKSNLPFDKAYPLARKGFIDLAYEFKIDPAVLFQLYIELKK